jgi:hypothetical protein
MILKYIYEQLFKKLKVQSITPHKSTSTICKDETFDPVEPICMTFLSVLGLHTDLFAHSQLYTALLSVQCQRDIQALFPTEAEEKTMANIVYRHTMFEGDWYSCST